MWRTVRGVSIERRLPLLMSLLLLVVMAALAGSAVVEVRRLALAAARARLEAVTTQLASSNADGNRSRIAALTATGRNDTLARALAGAPDARLQAERMLVPLAADTPTAIGVQLLDAAGRPALALGDTALMNSLGTPATPPDSAGIGALVSRDSTVAYPQTAPVRAAWDAGRSRPCAQAVRRGSRYR